MTDNIGEILSQYKELDKQIDEYNEREYSKALDLSVRILSDIISKFGDQIGFYEITDIWGGIRRTDIILEIKMRDNRNSSMTKEIKEYILERYPDAEHHCSGIILGRLISKQNLERSLKVIEKRNDFAVCTLDD